MVNPTFITNGINNRIVIGKNSILVDPVFKFYGNNHQLIIGDFTRLKNTEFWFEDSNCEIRIGNNTSVEMAHLAVTEPGSRILMGEDCMLANNIQVRTGDSHSILDAATGVRINYAENVVVGNHVWIGENVTVLKGVRIGDNSIIATGAIVSKSVGPGSLAVGIPAKVIKENISWKRERIYEKT